MADRDAAASRTLVSAEDPLSALTTGDYERDMAVNLYSAVIAAQEAVRAFAQLPDPASKTFIYTGNKLNVMTDPKVITFGIARAGAAHFIWDCSVAYRSRGFKYVQAKPTMKTFSEVDSADFISRTSACLMVCLRVS